MVTTKLTRLAGLSVLILSLISYQTTGQTSGPRKPPAGRPPAPTTSTAERPALPVTNSPAEVKRINGFEITLLEVKGNAVSQTVMATLRIMNPGGNNEICTQQAYAVDTDGNQYRPLSGRSCAPLFTDVPLKWVQGVKGIPPKIKTLALFTFSVFNKSTRKSEVAEFRNLPIDWQ